MHRFVAAFGNESYLDCPEGMALGPNNTLYVASFLDDRVVKFSLPDGAFLGVVSLQRDAIIMFMLPQDSKNGPFDTEFWGTYHVTANFGNSGWKVNGKVTFRKFQPKIEEYVLK